MSAAESTRRPLRSEDTLPCSGAFSLPACVTQAAVAAPLGAVLQRRTARSGADTAPLRADFSAPTRLWRCSTSLLAFSLRLNAMPE